MEHPSTSNFGVEVGNVDKTRPKPLRKKQKVDASQVATVVPAEHKEPKKPTRRQSKSGKLAGLMNLPMDVLWEVWRISFSFSKGQAHCLC